MYINENLEVIDLREAYPNSTFPKSDIIDTPGGLVYRVKLAHEHPDFIPPEHLHIQTGVTYEIINEKAYEVIQYREMNDAEKAVAMIDHKNSAKGIIDARVEAERMQYITPGSGQSMVYEQKYNEAMAYVSDPEPDIDDYPHIKAEIGTTADTAQGVAQVIIQTRNVWIGISAALEGIRLAAKKAVGEASTPDEIDAAITQFNTDLENAA